jgi:hypothetical protein
LTAGKAVTPSLSHDAAPVVSVTRGLPAAQGATLIAPKSAAVKVSTIQTLGESAMSEDEAAEDAESAGYTIMAADNGNADHGKPEQLKSFSKTGLIRQTEAGLVLQASNGLFKSKKNATVFTLSGSEAVLADLQKRIDKKALIKGLVNDADQVTVTSVKGVADLGFLTNWLSRGKIAGTVKAADGTALAGASVDAKSADGFVFHAVSETDGSFALKNLTPGTYAVSVKLEGYQPAASSSEVKKMRSTNLGVSLAPVPAASETVAP